VNVRGGSGGARGTRGLRAFAPPRFAGFSRIVASGFSRTDKARLKAGTTDSSLASKRHDRIDAGGPHGRCGHRDRGCDNEHAADSHEGHQVQWLYAEEE